jgi:hypothetical protein
MDTKGRKIMINPEQAHDILSKVNSAIEENKPIQAMRMIGMEWDLLEDMTMTDASEAFQVRVHDLVQIAKGNDND